MLSVQPELEGEGVPPVANVAHTLIEDIKPGLKTRYGELFSGTADLYTFFYLRGVQLLAPGGMFAFISSNKWFRAAYGEKLRGFMAKETAIRSITDFGDLPVFNATAYPMIFVAQKVVSPSRRSDGPGNRRDAETTLVQRQGFFLPHWTMDGSIYHVVFRLRDSLPREVLERFEDERRLLERQAAAGRLNKEEAGRLNYLVSERVEQYLDAGHGECLMNDPRVADVVQGALQHFDGERYRLHAWAVMPNHVHVVVQPLPGHQLSHILHSWKSFTAHEINRLLGRTGEVWMKESYDHIIRNEASYHRVVQYVLENPSKGKLAGWKWVGKSGSGVPPDSVSPPAASGNRPEAETTLETPTFTQVKSLDPPYPDVKALIEQGGFSLPAEAIQGSNWTLADKETLARLRKMEASGVPLGEYVKGKIYRGILTGFNEAFVIDGQKRAELIAEDPKSAEIIKPLAVGDDVRRWRIRESGKWLIVTKIGVDMKRYPAIFKHLSQWKPQLIARQDQGEHWWELRACAYYAEFDKPKIVFPDIAVAPRFACEKKGLFYPNTLYIVPVWDLFLLGVLNSSALLGWYLEVSSEIRGGYIRYIRQYVERLPIPRASDADRDAIAALVQKCLDAKAKSGSGVPPEAEPRSDPRDAETTLDADVSAFEAEIDARVEFLYFHQDEAPTYDEWIAGRRPLPIE